MNSVHLFVLAGACASQSFAAPVVFFRDFNAGVPAEISGVITTESVQGYDGIGSAENSFSGEFLRNFTGGPSGESGSPTRLTLNGLAPHSSVNLQFLLAIIDSWDGSTEDDAPDFFNISIDGTPIFSETFDNFIAADQSFVPAAGSLLTARDFVNLGFNEGFPDAAYDMVLSFPHSASTLIIEFWASGDGWQAGADESWALDNLRVSINPPTGVPETGSTILLLGIGLMGLVKLTAKRGGGH